MPPDAVLISDTRPAGIWTEAMVDLTHPDQSYLRCAGSLGWAFTAALGAKCVLPERPVLCFTGDGGFWYHLSEMETAARYGINTVTVVNDNCSLNQVRRGVERVYAGRTGNSDEVWQFRYIDFADITRRMGCFGIRVEHRARSETRWSRRSHRIGRPSSTWYRTWTPWLRLLGALNYTRG